MIAENSQRQWVTQGADSCSHWEVLVSERRHGVQHCDPPPGFHSSQHLCFFLSVCALILPLLISPPDSIIAFLSFGFQLSPVCCISPMWNPLTFCRRKLEFEMNLIFSLSQSYHFSNRVSLPLPCSSPTHAISSLLFDSIYRPFSPFPLAPKFYASHPGTVFFDIFTTVFWHNLFIEYTYTQEGASV